MSTFQCFCYLGWNTVRLALKMKKQTNKPRNMEIKVCCCFYSSTDPGKTGSSKYLLHNSHIPSFPKLKPANNEMNPNNRIRAEYRRFNLVLKNITFIYFFMLYTYFVLLIIVINFPVCEYICFHFKTVTTKAYKL